MPRMRKSDTRILRRLIGYRRNWRSDAYYFLIYNAYMMIIAPTKQRRRRPQDFLELGISERLANLLKEDLRLVADTAERIAKMRNREFVTSTSVSIALGEVAEELKTSEFQIWGPDE